ncbi:hypothetical protein SLEP1_g26992 [Rubroshorea leprosula]|uniref:protein-serine/threonine phosphatase n=1 Tax=Rubroshorea leprosula TaxID=152421 RepID=A0AAV5K082_9ROSI|nr:hypothetical protein SLEP1_g26992 [Rubroshorea leprosula]
MATPPVSLKTLHASSLMRGPMGNLMPVYGLISIKGLSVNMNARWFVKEDFCRPDIFGGIPLHFFAVYDGHGSSQVSSLCKDLLHIIVAEELMCIRYMGSSSTGAVRVNGNTSSSARGSHQQVVDANIWEGHIQRALRNSFDRMDREAIGPCYCNGTSNICRCRPTLRNFSGSAANVVILALHHIIIANCGSSRVVLCRAGKAIPLSNDHKPDRPDELERIYAAGGKLIERDGLKVNGILNMTRAIGDYYLKEVIISKPEVTITERNVDDEFLILASDGLWSVLSDARACEMVSSCLKDESPATAPGYHNPGHSVTDGTEAMFPTKNDFAATILARFALARGSQDNISVIVVGLSRG